MKRVVSASLVVLGFAGCADVPEDGTLRDREGETGKVRLRTEEGIRTATYKIVNGEPVVNGDIVLPMAAIRPLYSAPADVRRWPGGVVPYEIDSALPEPQRVHDAIRHFWRETSIRFVPRSAQTQHYVRFVPTSDPDLCGLSKLGNLGPLLTGSPVPTSQEIKVSTDLSCRSGKVVHEMMHTLGTWHEQSRPDRDSFVVIHPENIKPGKEDQFDKQDLDGDVAQGPYDFNSIMHYSRRAFSVNGLDTMTRVDGQPLNTQSSVLSAGDMSMLQSAHPVPSTSMPAQCLTSRLRNVQSRIDLTESWADVGNLNTVSLHRSLGSGFELPVDRAIREGGVDVNARWMVGDFDGDGDQDLAAAWNDAGMNTVTVRRTSPSSIDVLPPWKLRDGTWLSSSVWLPGDFNNDGRTDIAVAWNDSGMTTVSVALSNGAGFGAWTAWATRQGGWASTVKWNVGDFDADGRDDLLAVWNNAGAPELAVRTSNGSSFSVRQWLPRTGGWQDSTVWLTGNFDGVLGDDVVAVWNDGGKPTLTAYLSNNVVFGAPVHWRVRDGGWAPNMKWVAGDVNADGRSDVVAAWNDNGRTTLAARLSTGSSFGVGTAWRTRVAGWSDSTVWCAGAFDGT